MKTFGWMLAGALALLAIGASGSKHQVAIVVAPGSPDALPAYDTLEEAGVHAIQRDAECSIYYECGGVIAQRPDGKFVVGPVSSSRQGDSVSFEPTVPFGWTLVADHHTHPCLDKTHAPSFFSPQDIESDTMQRVTGFMGDLCTGDVHEFTPGRDSPNDTELALGEGVYLTHGRIVGHITVSKTVIEPNTGL